MTPDSFSDGGHHATSDAAVSHGGEVPGRIGRGDIDHAVELHAREVGGRGAASRREDRYAAVLGDLLDESAHAAAGADEQDRRPGQFGRVEHM